MSPTATTQIWPNACDSVSISEQFTEDVLGFPACCEIYWTAFQVCEGDYRLTALAELNEDQVQGVRWGFDPDEDGDLGDGWHNDLTYLSFFNAENFYGDMWNRQHWVEIDGDGLLWVGVYIPVDGNPTDEEKIIIDKID